MLQAALSVIHHVPRADGICALRALALTCCLPTGVRAAQAFSSLSCLQGHLNPPNGEASAYAACAVAAWVLARPVDVVASGLVAAITIALRQWRTGINLHQPILELAYAAVGALGCCPPTLAYRDYGLLEELVGLLSPAQGLAAALRGPAHQLVPAAARRIVVQGAVAAKVVFAAPLLHVDALAHGIHRKLIAVASRPDHGAQAAREVVAACCALAQTDVSKDALVMESGCLQLCVAYVTAPGTDVLLASACCRLLAALAQRPDLHGVLLSAGVLTAVTALMGSSQALVAPALAVVVNVASSALGAQSCSVSGIAIRVAMLARTGFSSSLTGNDLPLAAVTGSADHGAPVGVAAARLAAMALANMTAVAWPEGLLHDDELLQLLDGAALVGDASGMRFAACILCHRLRWGRPVSLAAARQITAWLLPLLCFLPGASNGLVCEAAYLAAANCALLPEGMAAGLAAGVPALALGTVVSSIGATRAAAAKVAYCYTSCAGGADALLHLAALEGFVGLLFSPDFSQQISAAGAICNLSSRPAFTSCFSTALSDIDVPNILSALASTHAVRRLAAVVLLGLMSSTNRTAWLASSGGLAAMLHVASEADAETRRCIAATVHNVACSQSMRPLVAQSRLLNSLLETALSTIVDDAALSISALAAMAADAKCRGALARGGCTRTVTWLLTNRLAQGTSSWLRTSPDLAAAVLRFVYHLSLFGPGRHRLAEGIAAACVAAPLDWPRAQGKGDASWFAALATVAETAPVVHLLVPLAAPSQCARAESRGSSPDCNLTELVQRARLEAHLAYCVPWAASACGDLAGAGTGRVAVMSCVQHALAKQASAVAEQVLRSDAACCMSIVSVGAAGHTPRTGVWCTGSYRAACACFVVCPALSHRKVITNCIAVAAAGTALAGAKRLFPCPYGDCAIAISGDVSLSHADAVLDLRCGEARQLAVKNAADAWEEWLEQDWPSGPAAPSADHAIWSTGLAVVRRAAQAGQAGHATNGAMRGVAAVSTAAVAVVTAAAVRPQCAIDECALVAAAAERAVARHVPQSPLASSTAKRHGCRLALAQALLAAPAACRVAGGDGRCNDPAVLVTAALQHLGGRAECSSPQQGPTDEFVRHGCTGWWLTQWVGSVIGAAGALCTSRALRVLCHGPSAPAVAITAYAQAAPLSGCDGQQQETCCGVLLDASLQHDQPARSDAALLLLSARHDWARRVSTCFSEQRLGLSALCVACWSQRVMPLHRMAVRALEAAISANTAALAGVLRPAFDAWEHDWLAESSASMPAAASGLLLVAPHECQLEGCSAARLALRVVRAAACTGRQRETAMAAAGAICHVAAFSKMMACFNAIGQVALLVGRQADGAAYMAASCSLHSTAIAAAVRAGVNACSVNCVHEWLALHQQRGPQVSGGSLPQVHCAAECVVQASAASAISAAARRICSRDAHGRAPNLDLPRNMIAMLDAISMCEHAMHPRLVAALATFAWPLLPRVALHADQGAKHLQLALPAGRLLATVVPAPRHNKVCRALTLAVIAHARRGIDVPAAALCLGNIACDAAGAASVLMHGGLRVLAQTLEPMGRGIGDVARSAAAAALCAAVVARDCGLAADDVGVFPWDFSARSGPLQCDTALGLAAASVAATSFHSSSVRQPALDCAALGGLGRALWWWHMSPMQEEAGKLSQLVSVLCRLAWQQHPSAQREASLVSAQVVRRAVSGLRWREAIASRFQQFSGALVALVHSSDPITVRRVTGTLLTAADSMPERLGGFCPGGVAWALLQHRDPVVVSHSCSMVLRHCEKAGRQHMMPPAGGLAALAALSLIRAESSVLECAAAAYAHLSRDALMHAGLVASGAVPALVRLADLSGMSMPGLVSTASAVTAWRALEQLCSCASTSELISHECLEMLLRLGARAARAAVGSARGSQPQMTILLRAVCGTVGDVAAHSTVWPSAANTAALDLIAALTGTATPVSLLADIIPAVASCYARLAAAPGGSLMSMNLAQWEHVAAALLRWADVNREPRASSAPQHAVVWAWFAQHMAATRLAGGRRPRMKESAVASLLLAAGNALDDCYGQSGRSATFAVAELSRLSTLPANAAKLWAYATRAAATSDTMLHRGSASIFCSVADGAGGDIKSFCSDGTAGVRRLLSSADTTAVADALLAVALMAWHGGVLQLPLQRKVAAAVEAAYAGGAATSSVSASTVAHGAAILVFVGSRHQQPREHALAGATDHVERVLAASCAACIDGSSTALAASSIHAYHVASAALRSTSRDAGLVDVLDRFCRTSDALTASVPIARAVDLVRAAVLVNCAAEKRTAAYLCSTLRNHTGDEPTASSFSRAAAWLLAAAEAIPLHEYRAVCADMEMCLLAMRVPGRGRTTALICQLGLASAFAQHMCALVLDATLAENVSRNSAIDTWVQGWLASTVLVVGGKADSTAGLNVHAVRLLENLSACAAADVPLLLQGLAAAAAVPWYDDVLATKGACSTLMRAAVAAGSDRLAVRCLLRLIRRPKNLAALTGDSGVLAYLLRRSLS
jgi:hypothetical protein